MINRNVTELSFEWIFFAYTFLHKFSSASVNKEKSSDA